MAFRTLSLFLLTIEPEDPLRFSIADLRSALAAGLAVYTIHPQPSMDPPVHRYPPVQVKLVKKTFIVLGLGQGAGFLHDLSQDQPTLGSGADTCRISTRDRVIRQEPFGTSASSRVYEFQTPWLALNQQHAKKFYELKGKPARDAFMQRLLSTQLNSLAKSLDCPITVPISCTAKVRFLRERAGDENRIVFLGKFQTNLCIPDYFGIGRSVSLGYGTIKRITESEEDHAGEP
jgi:hypothetical protein